MVVPLTFAGHNTTYSEKNLVSLDCRDPRRDYLLRALCLCQCKSPPPHASSIVAPTAPIHQGTGPSASSPPVTGSPGCAWGVSVMTTVGVAVAVGSGVGVSGAGAGVSFAGADVAVGGSGVGVSVGSTGVSVGGTGVSVGGTGVSVGGTGVGVGGSGVSVGGPGVTVGHGVSVGQGGVPMATNGSDAITSKATVREMARLRKRIATLSLTSRQAASGCNKWVPGRRLPGAHRPGWPQAHCIPQIGR